MQGATQVWQGACRQRAAGAEHPPLAQAGCHSPWERRWICLWWALQMMAKYR